MKNSVLKISKGIGFIALTSTIALNAYAFNMDNSGSNNGNGGTTAPSPTGNAVPVIPEPTESCPDLTSGTIKIKGLNTLIQAGTPKATKGPILFAFHFTAGSSRLSSVPRAVLNDIIDKGGMVIRPTGNLRGNGRRDIAPPTSTWYLEDLEFVDQVVACAVKNHNIDPNQIYATGCSAGGLMAGTLGLMRSEYMAAVAPNSGGINYRNSRKLSDASHAPAAFLMHGGSADNVIVNFENTSNWFQEQNAKGETTPYMLNCNHGRGHCGAPSSLHELAWEFMKAHPYNVGESAWASSPPANLPGYCK